MLKVYGIKASRAIRVMWLCRELGLDFEHIKVNFADPSTKSPEFLAINPGGKVSAIDDDGFGMYESMAINFYLAKKYGSPLVPKDLQSEALILPWSFWVMTEIEKPLLVVLLQRMQFTDPNAEKYFRDRNPKNPELEKSSIEALQKPLATLDAHLAKKAYLLGNEFTLADLNVASVLNWAVRSKLDLSGFPNVQRWLDVCLARPGAQG